MGIYSEALMGNESNGEGACASRKRDFSYIIAMTWKDVS